MKIQGEQQEQIVVKIYNREYHISGEQWDPLYVAALAQYVDEQMYRIANTTHIVDTSKVAVLAALNIADELFKMRAHKTEETNQIQDQSKELMNLLDQALS